MFLLPFHLKPFMILALSLIYFLSMVLSQFLTYLCIRYIVLGKHPRVTNLKVSFVKHTVFIPVINTLIAITAGRVLLSYYLSSRMIRKHKKNHPPE